MTSVCFYFQVHQPVRLKDYSFFQIGADHQYEAVDVNFNILNRVADKCYLPTNAKLLQLIEKTDGNFKVAFSISGTALEQFEQYRPDVLESFKALADTGKVEFLAETWYHSLSSLYAPNEFKRQVSKHSDKIEKLFGKRPTVFRNTELIYSDAIAAAVAKLGYKGILGEGVDRNLKSLQPNYVFNTPGSPEIAVLLRHYRLSDDIAFRFSDKTWSEYPLLAPRFAGWIHALKEESETINIFLDYETFGEHRQAETGIFQFITYLPAEILKDPDFCFGTPSEIIANTKRQKTYSAPEITTWADEARDLSGWVENNMQQDALKKVYKLEEAVKATADENLLDVWSKLQTSDHFYYMSTKYWDDGVRQAFSPYKSPYDAYINYMNVLSDFEQLVADELEAKSKRAVEPKVEVVTVEEPLAVASDLETVPAKPKAARKKKADA